MSSLFISHNYADKSFVRKLALDLEKAGVCCWVDEAEIKVGDSLLAKIRDGIEGSEFLAAVLSPSSVTSEWVNRELEIALNDEIESGVVRVLPLLIQDCDIPAFLKGKLYADFRSNYKTGFNILMNRLLPKQSYDSELSVLETISKEQKVLVSFKNGDDRPVLRRRIKLGGTIGEIRKINPIKGGDLWVDLIFDGISFLQRVELFCYERNPGIRLTCDMDLQKLVSNHQDENLWRRRVDRVESAIWDQDTRIMSLIKTEESSLDIITNYNY